MQITRNGARPSQKRPGETFTGNVRIDPIVQAHIAIQEMLDGRNVEKYLAGPPQQKEKE